MYSHAKCRCVFPATHAKARRHTEALWQRMVAAVREKERCVYVWVPKPLLPITCARVGDVSG